MVSPTGFKHTGVFPEQAVNWAWYGQKIRGAGRPVRVLNLFGYTGGATLACAAAGQRVPCGRQQGDRGLGAGERAGQRPCGRAHPLDRGRLRQICGAGGAPRQPVRRADYGPAQLRPRPGGEVWKLEDSIYDLIRLCAGVLSGRPLFVAVNSYTTGLSPAVMEYMLRDTLCEEHGGTTGCDEIGLPVTSTGGWCPAGPPPLGRTKPERAAQRERGGKSMEMIEARSVRFRYSPRARGPWTAHA